MPSPNCFCVCCREREARTRYEERMHRMRREDALADGSATEPDIIRYLWERYKDQTDWSRGGVMHAQFTPLRPLPPPQLTRDSYGRLVTRPASIVEQYTYRRYSFHRTVERFPTHTVTRVVCEGITLEETVS